MAILMFDNLFNRKPKVVFTSLIPGMEKIMPIIPAKDYRHPWVDKASSEYSELRKQKDWGTFKVQHTVRCPGIFSLQRTGWIMRTYQDIWIETKSGSDDFLWQSALHQKKFYPELGDYVGSHPKSQLADYMVNWPEGTKKVLVKIHSPWKCIVPKGYYLLEMGLPYQDENRFQTVPGFFSHEHGPAQMNVQLLWKVDSGRTLIKAGTPISQYILIKKEEYDFVVNSDENMEQQKIFDIVNNCRFVKNYNEDKKFWSKQ